jgi:molybdenum cofactor synthesis domain-containing protein
MTAKTACVLIIGNEILSGKTQDSNLRFLAAELAGLGIRLCEARVLCDDASAIVRHLNDARAEYDYVFTTGGIGPTHDDITAECVAAAFGLPLVLDAEAAARVSRGGTIELNAARLKMAHVPRGATLIDNPLSMAPGFRIDNVFVLAGIPSVAQAMFAALKPTLDAGPAIVAVSVDVFLREGDIAAPLQAIAEANPAVEIGSYPFSREGRFGANLVVRGTEIAEVERVLRAIEQRMREIGGDAAVARGPRA